MDTISKVNRCRTIRKTEDISFRSEDIDIGVENVVREGIDIFFGTLSCLSLCHRDKVFEPVELVFNLLLFGLSIIVRAFFVTPVGSDTAFRGLIHLFGANLNFKEVTGVCQNRGV